MATQQQAYTQSVRYAYAVWVAVLLTGCGAREQVAPLTTLDSTSLESFQADFNRAADAVRVLVLLSPT
jgi:hypothetical protein